MTNQRLDECLQLLADQHRRRIIHHLRHETDGSATVDGLVDQLHDYGSDFKNGPGRDREELAIQLHHTHLPKLAANGVINYDRRSHAVRYDPDEHVETVLDSLTAEVSLLHP